MGISSNYFFCSSINAFKFLTFIYNPAFESFLFSTSFSKDYFWALRLFAKVLNLLDWSLRILIYLISSFSLTSNYFILTFKRPWAFSKLIIYSWYSTIFFSSYRHSNFPPFIARGFFWPVPASVSVSCFSRDGLFFIISGLLFEQLSQIIRLFPS